MAARTLSYFRLHAHMAVLHVCEIVYGMWVLSLLQASGDILRLLGSLLGSGPGGGGGGGVLLEKASIDEVFVDVTSMVVGGVAILHDPKVITMCRQEY